MIAFQTIRHLSVVTLAALGFAGITAAIGLVATAPALAAEKTADVGKYCRKVHGRDAIANIDRRDDGLLCTRPLRRGPGMLHRKIKAADVCADQHRTQRFRRQGLRLTCITGSGGSTQTAKTIDLLKYCRTRYGPKAFVTRRRTDDRPMCSIRTDRGLGLRHHLIDLTGLCGGGSPRAVGNTLKCSQTSAGATPGGGGFLNSQYKVTKRR
ncbi:MAG: hypothetical protein O7I42_19390 [Alphaproteobacteria bacterium]|nr:hypothetical protein [Alphaproteobacteria bacterium]